MPKPRIVQYPFGIRPGVLIYLYLPADLTMAEVKRVTAMMETLTVDGPFQEQGAPV